MLSVFMLLKLKFNRVVAFHILCKMDPEFIFMQGIKTDKPWLCEIAYRPEYLDLEIDDYRLITWSIRYGNLEIVKWLYSVGAVPKVCNDYAIRWAAESGHLDVVKWLYSVGAAPRAGNEYAIRWAAANGHLDVVKWLYSVGVNPRACDDYALRWATRNRHLDVVEWLMSVGCVL